MTRGLGSRRNALAKKREIYCEILFWALPYIRNVESHARWRKALDRSCYHEAELAHPISNRVREAELTEADVAFLNDQSRS